MTKRIIDYLLRHDIIAQQDAAIYVYGLQTLFQSAACYGTILLLALLTHHVIDTLVFWVIFLPIRQYAGGYHCSTPLRCFFLSVVVWAAIMALCRFSFPPLLCVLSVLSAAVLWYFAPLPHPNNPLSPKRMQEVTRIIHWIIAGTGILFAILLILQQLHFAALICYILLTCALSLLAARSAFKNT